MAAFESGRSAQGRQKPVDPVVVGAVLGLAVTVPFLTWATPLLAAWVHSGRVVGPNLIDAMRALGDKRLFGPDPASAYPPRAAATMQGEHGARPRSG